ncbi:MAG: 2-amino-4-hydroxy-6-hydroxymethyldihydropteridine diphosphokinase [Phascolarctobacterium sp.]|nr:2-amino-4-hydroxy-6-hydroxymethyldihydropteridine diphosphokinase [Phascolarctobacterium sp.]
MCQELLKHEAYIALGSNLGNLKENLETALKFLEAKGIEILAVSDFISTEPYGVIDQPKFLNAVCKVATTLEPLELLRTILGIENAMGRVRKRHWGERNIDLDLILYEDVVMDMDELKLPHPDMQNRDFVLLPLVQIAPEVKHPLLGKTIRELLSILNSKC